MAQARRKKHDRIPLTLHVARGLREGIFLVLFTLAVYLLISLITYHSGDPGWSLSDSGSDMANRGGVAGAWFADVFLYLFGYPAYLFPIMVGYSGWLVFHGRMAGEGVDAHVLILRWSGFVVTVVAACGLAALHYDIPPDRLPLNAGGILGDVVYGTLVSAFSFLGATLFLLALFFAGITVFTGLSWLAVTDHIGRITLQLGSYLRQLLRRAWDTAEGYRARQEREEVVKAEQEKIIRRKPVRVEPIMPTATVGERVERERQVPLFEPPPDTELPPLALLDEPPLRQEGYSNESLEAMSRLVELKLADFGVEVEVVAVHPGPVVTRFELQPGAGVKVSQITNLAKDLARALATLSVRVVEIIPGKPVVGLEIPNEYRELVALSEILRSAEYDQANSPLTLALGKDIGGQPVVADLTRMPHLLVAGTTGSGKSVAINGMVLSLLYKTLPTDVRLIMIDPKMLELSVYEGIPHLLTPVVTDMREAATALRWCVGEMERRYRLMAALGVRNIAGYNRKVRQALDKGEPIPDPTFKVDAAADADASAPDLQPLPFIVVIVDELADMMMVVGKKVEQLIARLAQKARAAGIHLILATQRPSVDVITGLIKANIPSRIAFQVSSRVDSRTILDQMGADQLLGHGDMLYLPPGMGVPMRIHGAFVSDQEVHKVVAHLRGKSEPVYLEEVLSGNGNGGDLATELPETDAESDPLYDQAVVIVTKTRRASISGVQRRLKVGYNRAARMIEQMEVSGIVGPLQSNGSREVIAAKPPEV